MCGDNRRRLFGYSGSVPSHIDETEPDPHQHQRDAHDLERSRHAGKGQDPGPLIGMTGPGRRSRWLGRGGRQGFGWSSLNLPPMSPLPNRRPAGRGAESKVTFEGHI